MTLGNRYIKGEHFHLSKRGAVRSPLVSEPECSLDCPHRDCLEPHDADCPNHPDNRPAPVFSR
jgi:hypothetical protein